MLSQARLPLVRPRNPFAADPSPASCPLPSLPPLTTAQRDHLRVLPKHIVAGLRILRDEAPPMLTRPEVWAEIATDAIMLAADGWAAQAYDQGWTEHDVFGCAADPRGDDDLLGLAGYLRGRNLLAISSETVTLTDQVVKTAIYRQPCAGQRVFLWEYGR